MFFGWKICICFRIDIVEARRVETSWCSRDKLVIIAGNNDEMRRLGHEDTARETGSTGSNQVTFGREGIFAQRPGWFSAAATFLPAKSARACSEHAQRNYQGRFCFSASRKLVTFALFLSSGGLRIHSMFFQCVIRLSPRQNQWFAAFVVSKFYSRFQRAKLPIVESERSKKISSILPCLVGLPNRA